MRRAASRFATHIQMILPGKSCINVAINQHEDPDGPALLGRGIPLVTELSTSVGLTLTGQTVYEKSGVVSLLYALNKRGRPIAP